MNNFSITLLTRRRRSLFNDLLKESNLNIDADALFDVVNINNKTSIITPRKSKKTSKKTPKKQQREKRFRAIIIIEGIIELIVTITGYINYLIKEPIVTTTQKSSNIITQDRPKIAKEFLNIFYPSLSLIVDKMKAFSNALILYKTNLRKLTNTIRSVHKSIKRFTKNQAILNNN